MVYLLYTFLLFRILLFSTFYIDIVVLYCPSTETALLCFNLINFNLSFLHFSITCPYSRYHFIASLSSYCLHFVFILCSNCLHFVFNSIIIYLFIPISIHLVFIFHFHTLIFLFNEK